MNTNNLKIGDTVEYIGHYSKKVGHQIKAKITHFLYVDNLPRARVIDTTTGEESFIFPNALIKSPISTPRPSVLLPRATADLKRVPKKTLNVSKVSEQDIQEDISVHEDTSLFKLTKTGSTRLYVGVCIVALIAIYAQSKIFKKIIK